MEMGVGQKIEDCHALQAMKQENTPPKGTAAPEVNSGLDKMAACWNRNGQC